MINDAYVYLRDDRDGDRSLRTKYYTEPLDPKSYYDLGVKEAERENYREAIYNFSFAIKLDCCIYTKLRSEVVFLNEEKKLKNAGDRARNKARLSLDRVRLQLGLK